MNNISTKLLLQDTLEHLITVPDETYDMILADPPYMIGFDGRQGWDSIWRNEREYLDWCHQWSQECARVLRPQRMMVVWGTLKTDTFLRYKLEVLNSLPLFPQNEIIWSYNWGGRTKKNFARKHEYAWCYSKSKEFLFNGDDVRIPRKMSHNPRNREEYKVGTIPTSIWESNNHTGSKDFVNWHPTTKNLSILERLIRAYTLPGETVYDPFAGSASTNIAAMRTGRMSVSTEINSSYYQRALQRIAQESSSSS